MLVLTRGNGEQLQLVVENNQVIAIMLTNIHGKQVQIGFEAPPASRILRKELVESVIPLQ
jgi:carbon storage regulator CsrA